MYYITNHDGLIIAMDDALSSLLGIGNMNDLYRRISSGDIVFGSPSNENLALKIAQDETTYSIHRSNLTGVFGSLTLIEIVAPIAESTDQSELTVSENKEQDENLLILEEPQTKMEISPVFETGTPIEQTSDINDLISIKEDNEDILPPTESKDMTLSIAEEEAPLNLEIPPTTPSEEKMEEPDLYELILPESSQTQISQIEEAATYISAKNVTPIYVDAEAISKKIGISVDDYHTFLNEYIDTALHLESDLKSSDETKQKSALRNLIHLSEVLNLDEIGGLLQNISAQPLTNRQTAVDDFYKALSKLTTFKMPEAAEKPVLAEGVKTQIDTGFGSIDLSGVKPIHFDFQMEQAAKELSLPVELIEEFVHDFIEQAHTETKKMLEAYERGDLSTIQKIGHMLKGAASNLRIEPLADTLYDIQFCEDSSNLENLIKRYWGHFLSFETQIKLSSK